MKNVIVMVCLMGLVACNQTVEQKTEKLTLDSDQLRFSYALGVLADVEVFEDVKNQNRAALIAGIKDGLDGAESRLSKEDLAQATKEINRIKHEKKIAEFKKLQAKNKVEGDAFLRSNAKKKGVIVTDSGLQYEVIKAGDGPKPEITDRVRVLYDGKLMDGTRFNPYHKPEKPARFKLDSVIKGWQEGLMLMNVGSKYRFVLPPKLAFGEAGAGANIPPNAVMIFEIELLVIEHEDPPVIQKSGNYTLEVEH